MHKSTNLMACLRMAQPIEIERARAEAFRANRINELERGPKISAFLFLIKILSIKVVIMSMTQIRIIL